MKFLAKTSARSAGAFSSAALKLGLAAALGLGGCAVRDAATTPLSASQEKSMVQLEVSYSRALASGPMNDADGVRLDAEAHFIRYRAAALDEQSVASLLGVSRDDDLAIGACRTGASDYAPVDSGGSGLEVSLLDAGPLTVRNEGAVETVLEPHHYPELLPFVTGVVYGQEGAPARVPTASARLEIEATGGEDVGPFVAAATLSRGFPNLAVTRVAHSIELNWSSAVTPPAGANGPAPSNVLVDLRWSGAHAGAVRCRAADDGHLDLTRAIPVTLSAQLDEALAQGAVASASVSRTEQATLDAPGAGAGRLLVTLRDSASVPAAP